MAMSRWRDAEAELNLPPGFRFHPTDEELVVHYLCRKIGRQTVPVPIIAEVDLYKFSPWDLPDKALFGQKEWYFFTPRDRKYPNGSRPNRAAGTGYWKATGADKPVSPKGSSKPLGIKKALVFYSGKAPRGVKTDWIMHEYRLADSSNKKGNQKLDEWVLCRLYNKKNNWQKLQRQRDEASHAEVMDLMVDTLSDSFQTHDSEVDNVEGHHDLDDMVQFGAVPGQQQRSPAGTPVTRAGNLAMKEDNEWFAGLNFDDLQAPYMSFGSMVSNVEMASQAISNDYGFPAINSPQMKLYQTTMPPF